MPRFVLEIGTEELPPRFFPSALAQLKEDGERMLQRARLSHGETKVYGTPRRLVFLAENVAATQSANTREERGPAAKVAFDAAGKPTKAAAGFASRHGLTPEQLVVRETEQGSYVFAIVQDPELPAAEALAQLLPGLVSGLSFPKTMRWGTGKLRFGRPVRWLLALLGSEVVEFEVEGLQSGRLTRGHPVLDDGMHAVAEAEGYEETLRKLFVIVDPDERQYILNDQLNTIAQGLGARVEYADVPDGGPAIAELLTDSERFADAMRRDLSLETAFLVEYPTAAYGSFDTAFLELPEAVLVEEMEHVQSYFPVREIGNVRQLVPKFVAVRDGGNQNLDGIVAGWENVLRAKLIDAKFFYEQDLKTSLADQVDKLKGVAFHEKLGTTYEKMERVRAVAAAAALQVGLSVEDADHLDRAAYLCKADLVTEVVQELTNLQGIMGRVYAEKSGENKLVWDTIWQQYYPRFAGDDIPQGSRAQLLALSDKLDTISSYFAIGLTPSSSGDPFGLRREATGIVRIITEGGLSLSCSKLIAASVEMLRQQVEVERSTSDVVAEVLGFLRQRLEALLRDPRQRMPVRYDLVDAALTVGLDDLFLAKRRADALQSLSETDDFLPTVIACTRPINISKDFAGGEVDTALFQEEAERVLWEAYQQVAAKADSVNLLELFQLIATDLVAPINRYFDEVMVMVEDEQVRNNRLATCWYITQLCRRIGDFTKIVQA